jgi:hypothetical protein
MTVFRKVALERLASPDQLDQLLQITRPTGWLALGSLAALLGIALVWGFTGTVPIEVQGQGMLLRPKLAGDRGASVTSGGVRRKELMAVLYVSASEGERVRPGMEVKVALQGVHLERLGFLQGEVHRVSKHPSSSRDVYRVLGDQESVGRLFQSGPPVRLDVVLRSFHALPSWITSGTPVRGSVTVSEVHPISLLFRESFTDLDP